MEGNTVTARNTALNGLCPYFTMFPLDFPHSVLSRHAQPGDWVLDPFCGRGTTNYASRLVGLPSVGIDSSQVAVAVTQAKLANTSPELIARAARRLLDEVVEPHDVPTGEFWEWAFHRDVLHTVCRLREGLMRECRSDTRKALRALLMGALHGPRPKSRPTYLSNQSQRTYAPKPRYAVKFWRDRDLTPSPVDVLGLIDERALRYFGGECTAAVGRAIQGDSRISRSYARIRERRFKWVITSPPYYGMRTYVSDQWLRAWFVGGPPTVDYTEHGQIAHPSPDRFAAQLALVWRNTGAVCIPGARMVVRFGGIHDRMADPLDILRMSLKDTGWKIDACEPAGSADNGRRQALHFANCKYGTREEHDVWATWQGK